MLCKVWDFTQYTLSGLVGSAQWNYFLLLIYLLLLVRNSKLKRDWWQLFLTKCLILLGTLNLQCFQKITVGINDKFEKSWSATWKTSFFPTSTRRPRGKAATGKPGYLNDILCLSSMQIKLTKSWILKAYSLAYL